MENVASFLQYRNSPSLAQCATEMSVRRYEPTEAEIKARELENKQRQARDNALCIISTAEKLMLTGLSVETALEQAETFFERCNKLLADRTEIVN